MAGEDETVFDISKTEGTFIKSEEEARELLRPLSEPGNPYTKICFRNNSFSVEAARAAAPILSSIKHQLKEVDLKDLFAGRIGDEALVVMNLFSEALEGSLLKTLDLSGNALGEKGVRAFGKLLRSQTKLEELYLNNDGISAEAARAVFELLPVTDKLRVLQFHNNMTGDDGAIAISELVKRSPRLEDFRCSSTRVGIDGPEGCIALVEALKICTRLKKLNLRDNFFGLENGIRLSKTILRFDSLVQLNLSYLNLEDEGVVAIADALRSSASPLKVLKLAGNGITAKGASSVAACIAAKQHLVKLNLSENRLKDDGAVLISEVLRDGVHELKEIKVKENCLRRVGAVAIARSVVSKPGFELLLIDKNFISEEGIDELEEMFMNFPEKIGPLDGNDPNGVDDEEQEEEEEEEDEDEGSGDELGLNLEKLDIYK